MADKKLTEKEEAFCYAFIECHNYTEAYRKIYKPTTEGQTVYTNAYNLSKKENVAAFINKLKQDIFKRNKITIDELVHDLSNMVRFDPAEMYKEDGTLKLIHDMPKPVRQMIAGLDVQELFANIGGDKIKYGEVKKVKLMSKLDAIEKLMKHLGGYEKDNKQKAAEVTMYQLPDNKRD